MAYMEHGMWEIREVLQAIHEGKSVRSIAIGTGRDKKTVKRYKAAAEDLGWVAGVHEPSSLSIIRFLGTGRRPKFCGASTRLPESNGCANSVL